MSHSRPNRKQAEQVVQDMDADGLKAFIEDLLDRIDRCVEKAYEAGYREGRASVPESRWSRED